MARRRRFLKIHTIYIVKKLRIKLRNEVKNSHIALNFVHILAKFLALVHFSGLFLVFLVLTPFFWFFWFFWPTGSPDVNRLNYIPMYPPM